MAPWKEPRAGIGKKGKKKKKIIKAQVGMVGG